MKNIFVVLIIPVMLSSSPLSAEKAVSTDEKYTMEVEHNKLLLENKKLLEELTSLRETSKHVPLTTSEAVNSMTQSAKLTIETAKKVMETYETYFSTVSLAAGGVLTLFGLLFGTGFFMYFKSVFSLKEQYKGIHEKTEEQQKEIDDLTKNAHANIAAGSAVNSANASIGMYIFHEATLSEDQKKMFLSDSEELCNKGLEYDPQEPSIIASLYGIKGIVFGAQNKLAESCDAFKKSLEYAPDNERTLYNAACGFSLLEKNDEALDYLQRAVDINPNLCKWAKGDESLKNIQSDPKFPCAQINHPAPS